MQKVRIAVAGAGLIGLRHIEEIQRSQGLGYRLSLPSHQERRK